ncbi:MAG: C39 family peptidase [Anaerolineales bacterium]|jgi:hypothetical protein
MRNRKSLVALLSIPTLVVVATLLYQLPPINDRLAWRIDSWRAQIKYALNPPQEVVFLPQDQQVQVEAIVEATLQALTPSASPSPTLNPATATPTSPGPSATPLPTLTATPSPTLRPERVQLDGIIHEFQKWNNCGPANLAMALSYWTGPRELGVYELYQTKPAAYLKPNPRDKNVMPYEMVAYVNGETDLRALMRVGGDLETIKRFVAAGFPVLVEKGFEGARFDGWMGHYEVVSGYDDSQEEFFVYDSFVGPENAFPIPYEQIDTYWRHFNNTYIIIYPPEREEQVMTLLGPHADELYNYQQAAQRASDEIFTFVDRRRVFAWFNRGTNLVYLDDYAGAAAAYDEYFKLYAELSEKERPWRNLWYQSGPYWAYYYTQRYYDVIDLATTTIDAASEPAIEESWYWRALAKEALGDIDGAIADLEQAVDLNENFGVGWYHLERIRGGG